MLSLQLLSHELLPQRRDEEKEKTLFTKSIFPSLVGTYAIHVTGIFYHISVGLSIKFKKLTKHYCFAVFVLVGGGKKRGLVELYLGAAAKKVSVQQNGGSKPPPYNQNPRFLVRNDIMEALLQASILRLSERHTQKSLAR